MPYHGPHMNVMRDYSPLRLVVAAAAAVLFAIWVGLHLDTLTAAPDTWIRFALTVVFAALILLRPKPDTGAGRPRGALLALAGLAGAAGVVAGIVFAVHQFEWIGLLLVLAACLLWSLPPRAGRDALTALFLLYWAHPLPSQVLAWMQLTMQQISVTGSEWLLHTFNIRVWADGMVLRTGLNTYEIPAWCSGMRTATTVFLLALGLSIIKRLAWHQKVLAVAAALLQALLLNIVRITLMVLVVPRLENTGAVEFLHDSTGIIVLAAVFLVYVEIEALRYYKQRRDAERRELNPDTLRALRTPPPFWQRVVDHKGLLAATLVGIALIVILAMKRTPGHRADMYRGVARTLRDDGRLETAERAGRQAWALEPDHVEWRRVMLRLMLLRGKYRDVLNELGPLSPRHAARDPERGVLAAYSLMGLKRMPEAEAIVRALPEAIRTREPRVAMILAEIGLQAGDPDEVARHVVRAAAWRPNQGRIRALYPFLRTHRHWEEIVASDAGTPYRDPVQALSAAEAYMNLNRTLDVAALATRASADWPDDPRLLIPLFYLSAKRPDDGWEERFGRHLLRSIAPMEDVAALSELVDKCFLLHRPDLAWAIYKRVATIDPDHPALPMLAVHHGSEWFKFRRRFLGMRAGRPWETFDIRAAFRVCGLLPQGGALAGMIPLGDELAVEDPIPVRKAHLARALAAFSQRKAAGTLSLAMRYMYASALEIDDQVEAARAELRAITDDHPDEEESARLLLSEMLEREADWQQVYETLRTYVDADRPHLDGLLRLTVAQLGLHLGMSAVHTARVALQHFPNSSQAAGALAMALSAYDSPEASLFALRNARERRQREIDMIEAEALYLTQRFAAFKQFTKSALLPAPAVPVTLPQGMALPPAGLATLWHLVFVPTQKDFDAYTERLRVNSARATSPFLSDLYAAWLGYREADPATQAVARWLECGRDRYEKALALQQLCLLACHGGNWDAARAAIDAAVEQFPEAPQLRRFQIGLSGADPAVVAAALEAVPGDSEIWLASLVVRCRPAMEERPGKAALESELNDESERIVAADRFPPATLARAAELLLRAGFTEAAARYARAATDEARSLVPALITGLRCAILTQDRDWALECTRQAIAASLQPPPDLYRTLIQIKLDDPELDLGDDMVEALKRLRTAEPDNVLWPRMLAYIRFKRGGWEVIDSLQQAGAAIAAGARDPAIFIVGAEAARLLHNTDRAVELLRQGLVLYPGNTIMLNNLAYTLANSPGTAADALEFVPELLQKAGRIPWLADTIAYVYIQNDRLDDAGQALDWLRESTPPGTVEAFRLQLRKAQIAFRRDDFEGAAVILRGILTGSRGIPDEDLLTANRLLSRTDERVRELGGE